MQASQLPYTEHSSRDENGKLTHEHCRSHENFQSRVVAPPAQVKRKPVRLNVRSNHAEDPRVIGRQRGVVQAPPLQVMIVPMRDWQVYSKLHPVPLGFEVAMHRLHLVAGVLPETRDPSEESSCYQNERQDDPLRDGCAFDGPEERGQWEGRFLAVARRVQQDGAIGTSRDKLGGLALFARAI